MTTRTRIVALSIVTALLVGTGVMAIASPQADQDQDRDRIHQVEPADMDRERDRDRIHQDEPADMDRDRLQLRERAREHDQECEQSQFHRQHMNREQSREHTGR